MGYNGWTNRASKVPVYVPCKKNYSEMLWRDVGSEQNKGGNWNKNIKISTVKNIQNMVKRLGCVVSVTRVYSYPLDYLKIIKLRGRQIVKVVTNYFLRNIHFFLVVVTVD